MILPFIRIFWFRLKGFSTYSNTLQKRQNQTTPNQTFLSLKSNGFVAEILMMFFRLTNKLQKIFSIFVWVIITFIIYRAKHYDLYIVCGIWICVRTTSLCCPKMHSAVMVTASPFWTYKRIGKWNRFTFHAIQIHRDNANEQKQKEQNKNYKLNAHIFG